MSVLVPAYNAAATLPETIESVLRQTFTGWELVVVDDGSTDATAAVVAACADPRVRLVRQSNGGLAAARNRLLAEARGDYLAILDADDLARPSRLAVQAAFLDDHPDVDLCFTAFEAFDEHGTLPGNFADKYYPILRRADYRWDRLFEHRSSWSLGLEHPAITVYSGSVYRALAHGNFVHPPTIMMRRRLCEAVGPFDIGVRNLTDWEWLIRAARVGRFGYIDYVGIDYRRHGAQMSGPIYTEQLARDLVQVQEQLCRQDPALYVAERRQFDASLRDFQYILASVLANRTGRGREALRSLRRSLAYGWPGLARILYVMAKTLTPSLLLDAVKHIIHTIRPARG